ncbi:HIT family protein [Pseudomonas fluorescens]|uniref:HIT family protein n=1 Tax=Pseudomonas fluorescens TaxID=294 RepID=UPI00123F3950|nr:HIT family protein [Pseudomonas fluorescens]
MQCVFCDILHGKSPCHKIWEDEKHIAILSIYPNTKGFSVVIPKKHYPSYAFALEEVVLSDLVLASRKVALLLDDAFEDVGRTGMILEGFGVDHVHAKLFPMHGTGGKGQWKQIKSNVDKFYINYEGYISSHDHVRAKDEELIKIASIIRGD